MEHTLSYPIGKFIAPADITAANRQVWLQSLRQLPRDLRNATAHLTASQLNTPYRPDGWTVRQVVHHVADSHINAYMRFKLALTEPNPTIRPYEQQIWATLPDSEMPIEVSLHIIEGVHSRLVHLIEHMAEADFHRTLFHPADNVTRSLEVMLGLYAWHGQHHLAHITELAKRKNW